MPSSGTSRSKCGGTRPLSGRCVRSKEKYHLRGNLRHDWEGTGQGDGYLEHTLDTSSSPGLNGLVEHALQRNAKEEYENDRFQPG
jgi:hypothetical protein